MTKTLAAILCMVAGAVAQEKPDTSDTDDAIRAWTAFYAERARGIVATEETDPPKTLTLHPNALLHYSNPVRPLSQHGSVHLWTDRGLPRVIGTVWSHEDEEHPELRNLNYEFHSLSEAPLNATVENSSLVWAPRKSGLEWIELKGLPEPNKSRTLRLTQMRRIAAGWRATGMKDEGDLRLLPQPLYRYPENIEGPLDGAIFAFVLGTDPELFVVLEALAKTPGTTAGWRITPARLTGSPLTLMNDKEETLWSSPAWERYDRDQVYDFLWGMERRLPAIIDSSSN